MRATVWVGIALVIVGVALFLRGGFTSKEKVVDIGPLEVSAQETHPVPPWAAGLIVVAGVGLVAMGSRSRT